LYVAQDLQEVQASVYGAQRVLPNLSRALHLESGILGECRLSGSDGFATFLNNFLLAVFLFRNFLQMNLKRKSEKG
jgi:hypothetical protein